MNEDMTNLEKSPPVRTEVVAALKDWREGSPLLLKEYMDAFAREHGTTWEGIYTVEGEQVRLYIDAEMFDEAWVSFDQMLDGISKEEMERIKSSPIAGMLDQLENDIQRKINTDTTPQAQ